MIYEIKRIKKEEGLPECHKKPLNSIPETLWSICGGKSPRSIAVPIKFAHNPTNMTGAKAGKLNRLHAWNTTGANIKTTTTLSISIETNPARAPIKVTNTATLPFDIFKIIAAKKSGTPDFPK
jgi:hypothetical protein